MANEIRPLAQTPNAAIIDAIRDEMTPAYQARIPAATQAGLRATLEALSKYSIHWNSFYDTLMNRIGSTYINKREWLNKFSEFDRNSMQFGDTYQEIATGLIKAKVYNPDVEYLAQDAFGTYKVPVDSVYHTTNFKQYYPITTNRAQIQQAFLDDSSNGLGGLLSSLMEAQATSAELDIYLATVNLFAEYAKMGGYWRIHTPNLTDPTTVVDKDESDAVLIEAKTLIEEMCIRPNTRYNARHWATVNKPDDFMLVTTPRVKATLGVKSLAYMFNIEQGEVNNRVITIAPEDFGMKGAQAVIIPKEFFVTYFNLKETTNQRNAVSMGENYFLHVWKTISVSPFAQAGLLWTGDSSSINIVDPDQVDASTPEFEVHLARYTGEKTTPTNVARGDMVQLVSTVSNSAGSPENAYEPQGVKYSLGDTEKTMSQFTHITQNGMLHVGIDEPNTNLTVNAVATFIDPKIPEVEQTRSANLSVPVVGDGVFGFKPELIVSVDMSPLTAKVGQATKLKITGTLTDGRVADVTSLAVAAIKTGDATLDDILLTPKSAGAIVVSVRVLGIMKDFTITATAA